MQMNKEDIIKIIENNSVDENVEFLSNFCVKESIIFGETVDDFLDFLKLLKTEEIISLLDDDGIEMILNYGYDEYYVKPILTINIGVQEYLLEKEEIIEYLKNHEYQLRISLKYFNENTYNKLLYSSLENKDYKLFLALYPNVNKKIQIDILDKILTFPTNVITEILPIVDKVSIEYILQKSPNPNILEHLTTEQLIFLIEKMPHLDNKLTLNLKKSLAETLDFAIYRNVEFFLEKENNIDKLLDLRKKYIENLIFDYDYNNEMISVYSKLYELLKEVGCGLSVTLKNMNISELNFLYETIQDKIEVYLESNDYDSIKSIFQDESNKLVRSAVIELNFRDLFHNIKLDITELLKYNDEKNKTVISSDKVDFYQYILNIDNLKYEDLIKFDSELRNLNVSAMLYNDLRESKDLAYLDIKSSIINENTKQSFYNESFSNEFNVDSYFLDGEKFTLLSKSLLVKLDEKLPSDTLTIGSDAGSFSIVGEKNLFTYKNPKEYYNIVYTDFDINNVIHLFPVDSFSSFNHSENMKGLYTTDRLNVISDTNEFLNSTSTYNEIVIAQNNEKNDSYTHIKSNPTPAFILCYGEPTKNQIDSARELSLGLLIVNYEKYKDMKNKSGLLAIDIDPYSGKDDRVYNVSL